MEKKKYLRNFFLEKRNSIPDLKKKTSDLNFKLLNFLKTKKNKIIGGYYPIRNEVNIIFSLENLRNNNFNILLPRITEVNAPLVFCVWAKKTKLIREKYNIFVPETTEVADPDIIIVPIVVFDKLKYRVGYGGGYYDRTIEKLQKKKIVFTVGIAFDEQENISIPVEKHDKKLNIIITPSRILS